MIDGYRRKICIVTAVPSTIDAFLRDHIRAFTKEYEVTLVSDFSGTAIESVDGIRIKSIRIPRKISLFRDFIALFVLISFFATNRFSLVLSVSPKAGLLSSIAGFITFVPRRVHWFTGQVWATRDGLSRALLKFFDRVIALCATHLLADSYSQREFILSERVAASEKIRVLAGGSISGFDIDRFSHDTAQATETRANLDISNDKIVILYIGRLNRDKGVLDLAQAFSQLSDKFGAGIELIFVGPDEEALTKEIKRVCKECLERVCFVGYTSRPEVFMSASDILVLPSYREGFGSVVIEAASVGIPAVASDIYGLSDAVVDNSTGLLFQVGSCTDLKQKLSLLISDYQLRKTLGDAAKQRAIQQFSSHVVTDALMAYCRDLTRSR